MQNQLLDGIVRDYSLKLCFTGKFFEYNANSDRRCDLSGHQNEKMPRSTNSIQYFSIMRAS
jgi:hypothetical protein